MSRRVIGALGVVLAAGGLVAAAVASSGGAASQPPYGARLDAVVNVARRVYAQEADGRAARAAARQVVGDRVLADAGAGHGSRSLRAAAQHELLLPARGLVRLGVSRDGRRLVDVGQRFVLTPVVRVLPGGRGAVVRTSVRDVAGYVETLRRLTGAAIVVRGVPGHEQAAPLDLLHVPMPKQAGAVQVHGRLYAAKTFIERGWAGEPLRITVLVATPKP
jgi:hypothetical protein